jgi:hypothetical protein
VTVDEYCRHIEAYLCRKNDGHLIRIVGPSFERVCSWSEQGVPFKIACQGIDRYFERYYAKATRRRPVQIDFCEHDVLDAFDAWRRAVGVESDKSGSERGEQPANRRSLPRHLDRVSEMIAARRSRAGRQSPMLDTALDAAAAAIAEFRGRHGPLRGEVRDEITSRLEELDRAVLRAARECADPVLLEGMRGEAAEQLRSFRQRMAQAAYDRALDAAVDRLLREHDRLPTIAYD